MIKYSKPESKLCDYYLPASAQMMQQFSFNFSIFAEHESAPGVGPHVQGVYRGAQE